jgi:pyruvate,water dikinase
MSETPSILTFDDPRCRDVLLAGGKGAGLAAMTAAGLRVPPGFVITSAAFARAVDQDALRAAMRAGQVETARELVAAAEPPQEIEPYYTALDGPVAVRSSACAEDSLSASYAGQQESYLYTGGLAGVLVDIVRCWLSFFTDRAVFYRREKGSLDDVAMAVVIQRMVASRKSGVMFTVDPVHGRRDRMVVEAAYGLGDGVVSGEITPDNYVLDRHGVVRKRKLAGEGPVLNERECADLVELGTTLAGLYGAPQDIEWAFDPRGRLFVLQSRPVTAL